VAAQVNIEDLHHHGTGIQWDSGGFEASSMEIDVTLISKDPQSMQSPERPSVS
jgi:hypothetical protein